LKLRDENRPKASAPTVSIPDEVTRALSNWVVQASTGSRAESEERSVQAQAAADELARAGEELEAERDQLVIDIAAVTTHRDQAQATADERAAEIQRLLAEVDRERSLASAAQIDAAQAKLGADKQVEHLAEMRTRAESLLAAVEAERRARTVAEREAAVFTAQLAGVKTELEVARAQATAAQQDLAATRERVDGLKADLQTEREGAVLARAQLHAATSELEAERAHVARLQQDLAASRARLDERVQQTQDQLDAMREEHKEEMNGMRHALDSANAQLVSMTEEKWQLKNQVQLLEQSASQRAEQK
jgi:chromosome segregation ATPase